MQVIVYYFKLTSGKWMYTVSLDWIEDSNHYSGWKPFSEVVSMTDMIAICIDTPLGYPACYIPGFTS